MRNLTQYSLSTHSVLTYSLSTHILTQYARGPRRRCATSPGQYSLSTHSHTHSVRTWAEKEMRNLTRSVLMRYSLTHTHSVLTDALVHSLISDSFHSAQCVRVRGVRRTRPAQSRTNSRSDRHVGEGAHGPAETHGCIFVPQAPRGGDQLSRADHPAKSRARYGFYRHRRLVRRACVCVCVRYVFKVTCSS